VGDVQAKPSSRTKYPKDEGATAKGAWGMLPGSLREVPISIAGSAGRPVVQSASCTFLFKGLTIPGDAPFTSPPSMVQLTPAPRVLTVSGGSPLFDEDQAKDEFGNTITVTSSATWRSA
jgi:hypothetical protein